LTENPLIRHLSPDDDLARLTDLIHAAYAHSASFGIRYTGSHQSVEVTRQRYAQGQGLLALAGGAYVGTITARPPNPDSPVELFRDSFTWTIAQFCVLPSQQGRGIGKALHEAAMNFAREQGAKTIGLDTAAPNTELIAMYKTWGYELAGKHDFRPNTNYLSVIMKRAI
jgi:GNAT superfamily N-acetyltransferase